MLALYSFMWTPGRQWRPSTPDLYPPLSPWLRTKFPASISEDWEWEMVLFSSIKKHLYFLWKPRANTFQSMASTTAIDCFLGGHAHLHTGDATLLSASILPPAQLTVLINTDIEHFFLLKFCEPVSSAPPWRLHRFPPLHSCPSPCPDSSALDCDTEVEAEINPFLPRLLLVIVSYHSNRHSNHSTRRSE